MNGIDSDVDCSLAEGREPWTSGSAAPESEIEFESTVTCLSAASDGVVASGFEEGGLALADVRSQQLIWQVGIASLAYMRCRRCAE